MQKESFQKQFDKAKDFAIKYHKNKYDIYPYEVHLFQVVSTLLKFGVLPNSENNTKILISAWLHDVLEDTEITKKDIIQIFNEEISEIVHCVTDDIGSNRKERKAKVYEKIKSNSSAIIVKLADRIANVEFCIMNNSIQKFEMYKNEHKAFSSIIKSPNVNDTALKLYSYLNSLFKLI